MLYNHNNARGAKVIDVDTGKEFAKVTEVNTRAGWIKVAHDPMRFDAQGRTIGERIRFRSIYAIQGRECMPCLFHCYGRLP